MFYNHVILINPRTGDIARVIATDRDVLDRVREVERVGYDTILFSERVKTENVFDPTHREPPPFDNPG